MKKYIFFLITLFISTGLSAQKKLTHKKQKTSSHKKNGTSSKNITDSTQILENNMKASMDKLNKEKDKSLMIP